MSIVSANEFGSSSVTEKSVLIALELFFKNPSYGTPDCISRDGCLALAKQSNQKSEEFGGRHVLWNSWRRLYPVLNKQNIADFRNIDFSRHEEINFSSFDFGDYANFCNTIFGREANFTHANFGKVANFNNSLFLDLGLFVFAKFGCDLSSFIAFLSSFC